MRVYVFWGGVGVVYTGQLWLYSYIAAGTLPSLASDIIGDHQESKQAQM